jgi:rhamnogalacturonan endolyase
LALLLLALALLIAPAQAQRRMEKLNRGVVAVRTSATDVYVGWRVLGTDPAGLAFNVYRGAAKINATPITGATNLVDATTANETYTVRPVRNGVEEAASAGATVWADKFLRIPIQRPTGGTTPDNVTYTYGANDCSVGDVDGDGQYEIILKWDPSNAKDNSQSGYTGNVYIDAYRLNGTRLWRIDLGRNIRAGAHYTQLMVYDFDSDGKAEVAVKTADGTVDGKGTVIGDATADYRNSTGYVLTGPEFLTIFNGKTGAAMATTAYLPARGAVTSWGDNYGNRVDRFVSTVAYLDGQRPSLVMGRGYYTRLVRVAWDWRNGQLTRRWTFDSDENGNSAYAGQGNHQLTVGDVNGDGKDEVVNGPSAIKDDGTGLYVNGLGHGDALHMSDMNPDRPGQEVWQPHETPSQYGVYGLECRDALTGQPLWGVPATGDVGRGLAADVDPNHRGYEMWGSVGGLYTCTGTQIGTTKPTVNFAVWWDGDLSRELLDAGYNSTTNVATVRLEKWVPPVPPATNGSLTRLLTPSTAADGDAQTNNTTKANPCLTADILGDWREEILLRARDNQSLLLYSTSAPTTERLYTLMHDSQYRLAVAHENSAYNQPPHTSFYLGTGMSAPPTPNIVLVDTLNSVLGTKASRPDQIGVAVYPNPTASAINIRSAGPFTYQIYNLIGQLLEQGERRDYFSGGLGLKPGLYMVHVRTASGTQTAVKVLKQ